MRHFESRITTRDAQPYLPVCLGCRGHGGGAWERSVAGPACTRTRFSVRLVWSRPSDLHGVESSGCPQCKCATCDSVLLVKAKHLTADRCFFCSWWNFDRKCNPSFLPFRKTKTFRQTQHLSTGTRYLNPNEHWRAGEESFTCPLTG